MGGSLVVVKTMEIKHNPRDFGSKGKRRGEVVCRFGGKTWEGQ
jgi:hypothetical protein